jgi:eukaryotic-like serine/threonine-protein kinase
VSGILHNPGDLIGSRYEVKKYIGQGGMQEVYLANDTLLKREVALKSPKNPSAKKRFKRSAVLSARVNHTNVAKTLDYVEENDKFYLIEEFVDGCDLGVFLRKQVSTFDPFATAQALHHLAKGLAASHHASVMHRDLKPSNVMVAGCTNFREFKITDFGIAKMAAEELEEAASGDAEGLTHSQTALGALPYMAPEMIEDIKSAGKPSDVWALGALAYELVAGKKPFGAGYAAVPAIQAANLATLPSSATSKAQFRPFAEALYEVIKLCIKKNPADRVTADELVAECEKLHYSDEKRHFGVVDSFNGTYGFIQRTGVEPTMFHRQSVLGDTPVAVGQRVWYAAYPGTPRKRAFPVVPALKL